jgi:hypothetical protein
VAPGQLLFTSPASDVSIDYLLLQGVTATFTLLDASNNVLGTFTDSAPNSDVNASHDFGSIGGVAELECPGTPFVSIVVGSPSSRAYRNPASKRTFPRGSETFVSAPVDQHHEGNSGESRETGGPEAHTQTRKNSGSAGESEPRENPGGRDMPEGS